MKRNYVRTYKAVSFQIFRAMSVQIVVFKVVTMCSLGGKWSILVTHAASICRVESFEVSIFLRKVDRNLWPFICCIKIWKQNGVPAVGSLQPTTGLYSWYSSQTPFYCGS